MLFQVAAHFSGEVKLCRSCIRTLEAMALRAAGVVTRAGSNVGRGRSGEDGADEPGEWPDGSIGLKPPG